VQYISDFERRLVDHARERGCEGVICGHIHAPAMAEIAGLAYINTGDWVENCTAFVEYDDGGLELIRYFDETRCREQSDEAFPREEFTLADARSPILVERHAPEPESELAVNC
jgi:hypothetical protein